MVNPIKAVGRAFDPLITATQRALTLPGSSQAQVPDVPPVAPAETQPTAKPTKKGGQQSFLSGVAASALGGRSGGATGKTLLGA